MPLSPSKLFLSYSISVTFPLFVCCVFYLVLAPLIALIVAPRPCQYYRAQLPATYLLFIGYFIKLIILPGIIPIIAACISISQIIEGFGCVSKVDNTGINFAYSGEISFTVIAGQL
jgi:hypothetical protein